MVRPEFPEMGPLFEQVETAPDLGMHVFLTISNETSALRERSGL